MKSLIKFLLVFFAMKAMTAHATAVATILPFDCQSNPTSPLCKIKAVAGHPCDEGMPGLSTAPVFFH
jgi:hypothetical protein